MPTFESLRLSAAARPLVDRALARASTPAEVDKVKAALVAAASVNGNKHLSAAEVKAVVDAFDAAAAGGTGALTPDRLGLGLDGAYVALKSMASLSNVDGISTHFTFNESLEKKLLAELGDAVASANGRPMDVCMSIFEFQSDTMGDAVLELAKKHPNVKFRIIGDSGLASDSGGNELPRLLKAKLPNIEVKYKKDFPYVWSATAKRPVYNHGATKGLNHHKGFATFVDGKPDRLVTGSFNWSNTADKNNYEDLTVFKNRDASSRRAVEQFGAEFAGYWNNDEASLSPNNFLNFKRDQWNAMLVANGQRPLRTAARPADGYAAYEVPQDTRSFDVNGLRPQDAERLKALVGTALARTIAADRTKYGRYDSLEELEERVPQVATLAAEKRAALGGAGFFGSGLVSVNNATLEELDKVGFTKTQARAIVEFREKNGDFESVDELSKVPGVTAARVKALGERLSATDVEVFFNSRPFGAAAGGTGYGPGGTRTSAVMGADGVVSPQAANVKFAATDLFNRARVGQTISVAMYGMSPNAPEFLSLVEAARRGVAVRVVMNDDFNSSTASAIKLLKAQGLPIDVRIQKAKTMHEKFGVVGDDVFSGSANFSESSSTKHSENRIAVKNDAELSAQFQARFDALWEKSKVV